MDTALRVYKVELHGPCVRELAILFHRIVRCKKAGTGNEAMKRDEHDEPFGKFAAFDHFATGPARILGSAQ